MRDMAKEPLTATELDRLIGTRDYREFLNPRNELYREHNMDKHPPSRAEAIRLMAENPNLIRRPLWVLGRHVLFGWDEKAYAQAARETRKS